jgi:hypothetical protein
MNPLHRTQSSATVLCNLLGYKFAGRLALALASLVPVLHAQYFPPPPAQPFPGYINQALRASDPYMNVWDLGVNVRLREEDKSGAGTTNAGSSWDFSERTVDFNNNNYQLTRIMPRVGYTAKWFAVAIEGRSSYSLNDNRYSPTAAGHNLPELDGPLDLYQGYVVIGNHKEFSLSLKIGRQELVYGDQRLVGHARWLNVPHTFDAAKLRYQNAYVGVDVFTGGLVYIANDHLSKANSQDAFSGAYFNFPKLSQNHIVEAYLFARNVARGIVTDNWSAYAAPWRFPAPQDLYTAGVRVKSKPGAAGPWDYTVETMYQFGSRTAVFPATTVAAALAAPRLTQSAYAAVAQLGYSWAGNPWQPRLALIGSYGSGDNNPTDGTSHTFQNLFPSNHGLYGAMDLSSLQNIRDLRLAYSVKPKTNISLAVEGHLQWLDNTNDYWYNVAGVPRNFTGAAVGSGKGYRINPSYGSALGSELDLLAGWTFIPSTTLELGLSRYFRGDYIKESLSAVGSKDAGYCYLQLTLNL